MSSPNNSSSFHEESGHKNPTNDWPFHSERIVASNIHLGGFRLQNIQNESLGNMTVNFEWKDNAEQAINVTS